MAEYLGTDEQLLLAAVLQLKDKACGAEVWREIERRSEREISAPAVYVALRRLTEKGFLESNWGEPTAVSGGRAKRIYRVTTSGIAALESAVAAILSMTKGLRLDLTPKHAGGR